jgi:hypothetical protein
VSLLVGPAIAALAIAVGCLAVVLAGVPPLRRRSARHRAEATAAAQGMLLRAMALNTRYLWATARGNPDANGTAPVVEYPNALDRQFPNGFASRAYMAGDVVDGIPLDADTAQKRNEEGGPASV